MKKIFITEIKKKNSTKHARTCVYRSKEILITCLNVVGKIKSFRKNENKNTENLNGLLILKHLEICVITNENRLSVIQQFQFSTLGIVLKWFER